MDLLSKLEPVDIFNIARLAGVTKIYDKSIQDVLIEINNKKGNELGTKVENYFLKENVNRSLINHNQKLNLLLNESNCYLKQIRFNNPKHLTPKDAFVILDKKNTVKFFNSRIPTYVTEYIVYTYVIPFLYYSNMTFNILLPNTTGSCKVNQLSTDRIYGRHMSNQSFDDTILYINTPYVEKSLYEMSFNKDTDIYYYIFQIIYTTGAFGKIGLIQNDLHSNNVRVASMKKDIPIKFVIDNTTSYNVNVKSVPLIYDFDFAGLDDPISGLLKQYGLPDKNRPSTNICEGLSVCNDADGGRRDTLLFLFRFMMTYYSPVKYVEANPRYSATSAEYLKKIFHVSISNQAGMTRALQRIKNGVQYQKLKRNYDDILDLIVNITNGQVKKFFKSIQDDTYIPKNDEWAAAFKVREGRDPNAEDWIFDVIYKNKIPECPLPVPYTSETMMSPVEILQSSYFKDWITNTSKVDQTLQPKFEVSINVDDEYIKNEYHRYMKEMFNTGPIVN